MNYLKKKLKEYYYDFFLLAFSKVYSIAWDPKGSENLVSSSSYGKVILWNTETAKPIKELSVANSPLHKIDWNKKRNELLATGSKEGYLYEKFNHLKISFIFS